MFVGFGKKKELNPINKKAYFCVCVGFCLSGGTTVVYVLQILLKLLVIKENSLDPHILDPRYNILCDKFRLYKIN